MGVRHLALLIGLAMLLCTGACSDESSRAPDNATANATSSPLPPALRGLEHRVCLAISSDGLGDKGYNDMQYAALVTGHARHGFELDVETMAGTLAPPQAARQALEALLGRNCTVVVAGQGWSMLGPVEELAPQHPEIKFFVVDASPSAPGPNVAGSRFHVEEAAFLAGYLAESLSGSHALASVGGAAIPAVLDFIQGFEAGAIHHNPHCVLHRIFLAEAHPKANPWSSPGKAQEVARALAREHKVDVLFAVSGGSNVGVFRAAEEGGLKAVGVDVEQDYLAKGVILTSVMKRVDVALERILDAIMANSFENRQYDFTLANNGVSLSPMTYSRSAIPEAVHRELSQLRAKIVAGEILVPSSQ